MYDCNNAIIVKDDENVTRAPSMGNDEKHECVFKRGYCDLHQSKGEKIIVKERNWRDRGGGKGFGWITSRRVKYRCKEWDDSRDLKSANKGSGGDETCGEYYSKDK